MRRPDIPGSGGPSGSVRLAAVGDLMLGDSSICTGYGFGSRYAEADFAMAMAAVSTLFGSADIVFGNLECCLSQHGHDPRQRSSTHLRGRPGYATGLRDAGFDIVSVANNHSFQHGLHVFEETVALLTEAGVACCGVRGIAPWYSDPVVMEAAGLRLGFLGYCLRPRQYSLETPPYAEGDEDSVSADIRRLKPDVDHVIVSLHWGEEYVSESSEEEVGFGHALIDAGAAVILGHHPHVPRPVERYRDGVIAYSLGNFMSDMIWYPPLCDTVVLDVALDAAVADVSVRRLLIGEDLLPAVTTPAVVEEAVMDVTRLDESHYRREVARTAREARWTGYRYAAANARRFRSPTLRQLIVTTARNKLKALLGRVAGHRYRSAPDIEKV
jgi:gamma-polyglutamate biosynthesis protein CapA